MNPKFYDVVCFGEILWDLLPSGARPGGAPMNVSYHVGKLGLPAALISRVGKDNHGNELLRILNNNGQTTDFIQIDPDHTTGVVNASIGENNEVTYEIVHPVAWDFIERKDILLSMVEQSPYFIFGSLVCRDIHSRKTLMELIEIAQKKVVDINLRPPHFTKEIVEYLLHSADIIKLNEHELPLISAWYHSFIDEEEQARWLQEHFSIPIVVVTKGGKGAFLCSEGKIFRHEGYKVKVADTIGSGDAFLAGFLSRMHSGLGMDECLRFANSMGAFIASKTGACPKYDVGEVMEAGAKSEM
ncbi:MAG: carbohydrate kinase family protein [Flavisolibacter sp.]